MQGEKIRECLHNGTRVYGTHVAVLSNPVVASALAAHLDFAFLCAEHMPLDRTELSALCCLFAAKGVSPVVRLSHPSAVEAGQALDAGAMARPIPLPDPVTKAIRPDQSMGSPLLSYVTG